MNINGVLAVTCILSHFAQSHSYVSKRRTDGDKEWPTPYTLSEYHSDYDKTDASLTRKQPVPSDYMVKLYEKLVHGNHNQSDSLPLGADTVRSFTHSGNKMMTYPLRMKFDVKIPADEEIFLALLQIHVKLSKRGYTRQILRPKTIVIQIMDTDTGNVLSEPVSVFDVDLFRVTFPLTKLLVKKGKANLEISLKVRFLPQSRQVKRNLRILGTQSDLHQPVVIVFTRDKTTKTSSGPSLFSKLGPVTPLDNVPSGSSARMRKRTSKNRRGTGGCVITDLKVEFDDIGYKNIIAPKHFNAFQCSGKCLYPLGAHSKANNHAQIQALMNSLYGENERYVNHVCCVPTKLNQVKVLYVDPSSPESIILRSFDDMVVEECGCR